MRRRLRRTLIALGVLLTPALLLGLCFALSDLPPLPVPPQEDMTLSCVTLIQPGKERRECATLRISRGRITAIYDSESGAAKGHDHEQRYVLPGLIDAHVHSPLLPADRALYDTLYLLHGITTVRNLGDGGQSLALKPKYESGRLAGPRLLSCGAHLDGPGGGFIARTVRTPEQGRRLVAELARDGADCIKVLGSLDEPSFLAVRAAASEAGLPLIGHLPSAVQIERARLDEVQHLTGVPDAPSPGFDDASWQRWYKSWDTVDEARIHHVVAWSLKQRLAHTPTLCGPAYAAQRDDPHPALTPRGDLLPGWHRDLWQRLDKRVSAAERDQARRNLPRYLQVVSRLHRAGVPILAGSDTFQFIPFVVPGGSLHDELRLLVRAGLSPEQALAAASLPVRSARTPGIGVVTVSGPADLIVLSADPTVSIDNLGSLHTVIASGRRYERGALSAHLRRQIDATRRFPYSACARLLRWIFMLAV